MRESITVLRNTATPADEDCSSWRRRLAGGFCTISDLKNRRRVASATKCEKFGFTNSAANHSEAESALRLVRERIRPQLKFHGFAGGAFSALDMPWGACRIG